MSCKKNFCFVLSCVFLFTAAVIEAGEIKYVFLFIGDGMSAASESAASRFLYGQDEKLVWHSFPVKLFMTTWSLSSYGDKNKNDNFDADKGYDVPIAGDKPYPYLFSQKAEKYFEKTEAADSAASGSAMSSGQKFFNGSICWHKESPVRNIVDILKDNGVFNTALLTTTLFYHATPASFFSHNKFRDNYKQIAEEILTKMQPELIFGCNDYYYLRTFAEEKGYYLADSSEIKRPFVFDNVVNKKIFINLDNYSVPQTTNDWNTPGFLYKENNIKFREMILLSVRLLLEKKKNFFMIAEQSQIDSANHDNDYLKMLAGVYELNEGVKALSDLVASNKTDMNWNNTLLLVTADHATGFLRFDKALGRGQLPEKNLILGKYILKRNDSVKYKSTGHTNELVGCYAIGAKSDLLYNYSGKKYKNIIDNTDIFKILKEVMLYKQKK
ncbi:MAG: alkaline phosphatase [Endomicrobiaceae bacterium]